MQKLLCYLVSLLLFSVASAQTPTVLDGDQVSRVGAPRNYVRNPAARLDTQRVTTSNATVTRSTTTPLGEGGTEFLVAITSNNGTATWALNTFSQALRGGICEARFRYRAATSTTLFQVLQGSNVVAQLTPTVDSTNTSLGSIPFPCGDLSTATTFRVTATAATLPTALELADIYVGAVQAFGDAANITAWQSYTPTFTGFGTPTGVTFLRRRNGDSLEIQGRFTSGTTSATEARVSIDIAGETISTALPLSKVGTAGFSANAAAEFLILGEGGQSYLKFSKQSSTEQGLTALNGNVLISSGQTLSFFARVPISQWSNVNSAVTPGSQNVWGGVAFSASATAVDTTNSAFTSFNSSVYGSANGVYFGAASALSTGTCGTTNDLGFCATNLQPGTYRVSYNGIMASAFIGTPTQCVFAIFDGASRGSGSGQTISSSSSSEDSISQTSSLFTYSTFQSSVAFRLQAARVAGGGNCRTVIDNATNADRRPLFTFERVDSRNTQPVFIQSPIRAAQTGTAPLTGEVGEQLRQYVTSSSLTNNTPLSLATVTLTPGTWDLSCNGLFAGSPTGYTQGLAMIGTTINSLTGYADGDNGWTGPTAPNAASDQSFVIPQFRVSVSANTAYYCTVRGLFTGGTLFARARLSAVRIGDR